MKEHYCHNCLHWAQLADRVYCVFCLDFFYQRGRLPRNGEQP